MLSQLFPTAHLGKHNILYLDGLDLGIDAFNFL
jgi:prepilin-type processing-associated H-X9-DG protein